MDIRSTKLDKMHLRTTKKRLNVKPSDTAPTDDTVEQVSLPRDCCEELKERILKADKKLHRGLWGYVGGAVGACGAIFGGGTLGQAYGSIGWVTGGLIGGTFAVASVAVGEDVRRTALRERHGAIEEAKESGCFKPGALLNWFYEEVSDTRVDVGEFASSPGVKDLLAWRCLFPPTTLSPGCRKRST
jgi:hypothetical protein